MNEKIKRKAHVKQSFSLDFLERGTFTEYPCLKRNADDTDYFINIVLSAFRHLCFISSCGITWLMGGNYNQVAFAVQNMIANLTGMICDGAKPSCALKVTTGVSTAVLSAMMAMEDRCVTSVEGIIDEDVDQSIRNLTRIGSQAMNETDKMVLDIMTHKGC